MLVNVLNKRTQELDKAMCDLSSTMQTADRQAIVTVCHQDQENHS